MTLQDPNFVSISSLELTHFTSADSDVKEKEFVENVENHFKKIGESFDLIIKFLEDRLEQDADGPKMCVHIRFCKLFY